MIYLRRVSDDVKNEAEVLAWALEVGAASVGDVVAWADAIIEAEEHPHWSVCELATMGARDEREVASALREVLGVVDERWVRDELPRRLARALAEDPWRADRIAQRLYMLAMEGALPEGELRSLALWSWDALDLAEQRITQETREDVIAAMVAALHDALPRR